MPDLRRQGVDVLLYFKSQQPRRWYATGQHAYSSKYVLILILIHTTKLE